MVSLGRAREGPFFFQRRAVPADICCRLSYWYLLYKPPEGENCSIERLFFFLIDFFGEGAGGVFLFPKKDPSRNILCVLIPSLSFYRDAAGAAHRSNRIF